jgi:hypothetical protein
MRRLRPGVKLFTRPPPLLRKTGGSDLDVWRVPVFKISDKPQCFVDESSSKNIQQPGDGVRCCSRRRQKPYERLLRLPLKSHPVYLQPRLSTEVSGETGICKPSTYCISFLSSSHSCFHQKWAADGPMWPTLLLSEI